MFIFEPLTDNYLKDSSYTVSYSPIGKSFDSFHTYIPDKLFNLRDGLFSFKDGKIYRHNADNKCIYYNGIERCYISPVFNIKDNNFILNNIYFQTDCLNSDGVRLDRTFNRVTVVNNNQGTKQINIVPFDVNKTAFENYDVCNTRRLKNGWFFNKFRDKKADNDIKIITEQISSLIYNTINTTELREGINRLKNDNVMFIFEFENNNQSDFYFYDADINITPTIR